MLRVTKVQGEQRGCSGWDERLRRTVFGLRPVKVPCEAPATWLCAWPTVAGNLLDHPYCDTHSWIYRYEAGLA